MIKYRNVKQRLQIQDAHLFPHPNGRQRLKCPLSFRFEFKYYLKSTLTYQFEDLNDLHPHQVSSQNYPGALCNVTYSIPTSCEEVTTKIVAQVIQERRVFCT